MLTLSKAAKSLFANNSKLIKRFCPDGSTCDSILAYGLSAWCFAVMYIAIEPLM